jgi:hypothetical protein
MLSGKFRPDSVFAADDHRNYNRHGEAFDVGETFSGVDYGTGLAAAEEFAALAVEGVTPAQLALRWVIDQPGVTTVIPGATQHRPASPAAITSDVLRHQIVALGDGMALYLRLRSGDSGGREDDHEDHSNRTPWISPGGRRRLDRPRAGWLQQG